MDKNDFRALTNPRSVAVVGATSPERSWFGGRAFRNLADGAPARRVYAINQRLAGEELLGRPVYGDMSSLPEVPDLAVVVTPAATVPGVLESIGQAGCRRVLLCAANREQDAAVHAEYVRAIRQIAAEHGLCL